MTSLPNPNDGRRRRLGFTLLELIIAIVLMSVLMMATWNLLGIYRNQFEKSQVRAERWQLVRSLRDQLASDLRSCNVRRTRDPAAETPEPGLSLASENDVGRSFEGPESPFPGRPPEIASMPQADWLQSIVGLEGSSRTLALDVITPKPADAYHRQGGPNQPSMPDTIRRVVYVFQSPREAMQAGRPPGLVRCEWKAEELLTIRALTSPDAELFDVLRQLQIPWVSAAAEALPSRAADQSEKGEQTTGAGAPTTTPTGQGRITPTGQAAANTTPTGHGVTGLLRERMADDVDQRIDYVPELKTFRLRYFDGHVWSDRWSSQQQASLPVAIELRMELMDPFWLQPDGPVDPLSFRDTTAVLPEVEPPDEVVEDERLRSSQLEPPRGFRNIIYLRPPAMNIEFEESGFAEGSSSRALSSERASNEALP